MKLVHKSLTAVIFSSQAPCSVSPNGLNSSSKRWQTAIGRLSLAVSLAVLASCAGGTGHSYSYYRSWSWSSQGKQRRPQPQQQQVAQNSRPMTPAERAQARRNTETAAAIALWLLTPGSTPYQDEAQRKFDENRFILQAEREAGLRSN